MDSEQHRAVIVGREGEPGARDPRGFRSAYYAVRSPSRAAGSPCRSLADRLALERSYGRLGGEDRRRHRDERPRDCRVARASDQAGTKVAVIVTAWSFPPDAADTIP